MLSGLRSENNLFHAAAGRSTPTVNLPVVEVLNTCRGSLFVWEKLNSTFIESASFETFSTNIRKNSKII